MYLFNNHNGREPTKCTRDLFIVQIHTMIIMKIIKKTILQYFFIMTRNSIYNSNNYGELTGYDLIRYGSVFPVIFVRG